MNKKTEKKFRKYFQTGFYLKSMFLFIFISSFASCNASETLEKTNITINGTTLAVEIAKTEQERAKGLMNRKSLDADHGMLFIFESDRKLSFWMKNTFIPLSIAFINSDGIIKEIRDMSPQSLEPVESKNYVRYALEVNRGYFTKNGIKPGDKILLPSVK
ncbi:MAG: DUF192 domain-containing protein [Spirochaetia bacterium]|jgi:uncharacterized membrane protein (UPF0127 family)|nr:DUF192 domain-containing protein [Spirochaetia bacterium]